MSKQNNLVAGIGARVLETSHRTLLCLTRGRFPNRLAGMDTLELHTTGRKSGQRRSTMLTAPIHDDRRVIVIASKGGHDDHPDWYKNLVATPEVEITRSGQTRRYRARTATAEEKAELWPQVVKVYKGYAGYQKHTERDIPVVICDAID